MLYIEGRAQPELEMSGRVRSGIDPEPCEERGKKGIQPEAQRYKRAGNQNVCIT